MRNKPNLLIRTAWWRHAGGNNKSSTPSALSASRGSLRNLSQAAPKMAHLVMLVLLMALSVHAAAPLDIKLSAVEQLTMRNQLPDWPVSQLLLQAISEPTLRCVSAR